MWEIFKSSARKEREIREKEEEIERKIRLKEEYRETIKNLNKKLNYECEISSINEKNRVLKANSECPKCHGHNIIDKICQTKGELHGNSFSSGGFGSGYVNGSVDTLEINKCKDCDNEWKKERVYYDIFTNTLSSEFNNLRYALGSFKVIEDCTFDPLDIKEEYSSLEDKKEKMLISANNHPATKHVKDFWEGTKIDVLKMIANDYLSDEYGLDKYYAQQVMEYFDEYILVEKLGFIK